MSRSIIPSFIAFLIAFYLGVNVLPSLGFSNLVTSLIAVLIYVVLVAILFKIFSIFRKK